MDQRPACACGRDWPEKSSETPVKDKEAKGILEEAESDPVLAASPFLLPLLRVLGGGPTTKHLAAGLLVAEQRKVAEGTPKSDSGPAAFSKAHDALRKAEKVLIRTKDDRAAAEAKLAKLITAEAEALE